MSVDLNAIKQQQRIGWQTGNYARIGNTLQIIAELLVEAADVHAGQRVLDVACGQGNAAIAAALRFAEATGVDYAPNLLDQARQRAASLHLDITFTEGDAEDLPFPDASFGDDVALALDFRTSTADPTVVASDFWTDPRQYAWRIVTPRFTEFATRLGIG